MPNLDIKYINVDREIERSRNLEKQLDEFALSPNEILRLLLTIFLTVTKITIQIKRLG